MPQTIKPAIITVLRARPPLPFLIASFLFLVQSKPMTNTPKTFRSPNPDEYWLDERIYVREVMNSPEEPNISLAKFRVPAGSTTQLHSLTITEWYLMESGAGIVEVDGRKIPMKAGDNLRINPGQSQRVINESDEELIFQSICTPRWTHKCYTNLETNNES